MKLEFLALKWVVTEKYNDYLYGHSFSVATDNNPLTYVLTTAKLDATGHRWLAALASYDFDIHYKPGKNNIDADALSRYPEQGEQCSDKEQINNEAVKAVCRTIQHTPYIETVAMSSVDIMEVTECPGMPMAQIDVREIRKQQREDTVLGYWIPAVKDKTLPRQHTTSRDNQTMVRSFKSLKMVRGVLYREVEESGQIEAA